MLHVSVDPFFEATNNQFINEQPLEEKEITQISRGRGLLFVSLFVAVVVVCLFVCLID